MLVQVKFLGKGAFGTVVLAREFVDITGEPVSPPRNVAIKFIPRGDKARRSAMMC